MLTQVFICFFLCAGVLLFNNILFLASLEQQTNTLTHLVSSLACVYCVLMLLCGALTQQHGFVVNSFKQVKPCWPQVMTVIMTSSWKDFWFQQHSSKYVKPMSNILHSWCHARVGGASLVHLTISSFYTALHSPSHTHTHTHAHFEVQLHNQLHFVTCMGKLESNHQLSEKQRTAHPSWVATVSKNGEIVWTCSWHTAQWERWKASQGCWKLLGRTNLAHLRV